MPDTPSYIDYTVDIGARYDVPWRHTQGKKFLGGLTLQWSNEESAYIHT